MCYGQGILIKGYKKASAGILTAKGFADTRARFETYDDILYFKNYRNAIFQILPASSFDINDELRYVLDNNLMSEGANLEILKAKAASEKDQFELNVKRYRRSYLARKRTTCALVTRLYSSTLTRAPSWPAPSLPQKESMGPSRSKSPQISRQPSCSSCCPTVRLTMNRALSLWIRPS